VGRKKFFFVFDEFDVRVGDPNPFGVDFDMKSGQFDRVDPQRALGKLWDKCGSRAVFVVGFY